MNAVKTLAAAAALALTAGAAFAQTSTTAPLPAKKPGILSRLFHPKPKPGVYQSNGSAMHPMSGQTGARSYSTMGSHSMVGGSIIGNKNTHVYHMAGDKGALPAPQNRVYFSSVAAAQAAGYHAAGHHAAGAGRGMTNSRAMMHGGMMTH